MSKKKLYNYLAEWIKQLELFRLKRVSKYNKHFARTHINKVHKLERKAFSSRRAIPGSEHDNYLQLYKLLIESEHILNKKTEAHGQESLRAANNFFARISPP
jgi:hypothetical protein|tara:strand:+ start:208 stop:513 length:306 start_codon:yes stop_codon:yes gene_type:complete